MIVNIPVAAFRSRALRGEVLGFIALCCRLDSGFRLVLYDALSFIRISCQRLACQMYDGAKELGPAVSYGHHLSKP